MSEIADAKAEGLTVRCPCGHDEWMHPEMAAPANPFFCGECGETLGTWGDVHRRLFTAGAMLSETLAKKA